METHTSWVHGNFGRLQNPHDVKAECLGAFLRIKFVAADEVWIHYTPGPSCVGGLRRLTEVLVRFRSFGDATIARLHVWDGEELLGRTDDVGASAEWRSKSDREGAPFSQLSVEYEPALVSRSAIGVSISVAGAGERDAIAISAVGVVHQPE